MKLGELIERLTEASNNGENNNKEVIVCDGIDVFDIYDIHTVPDHIEIIL